MSFDYSDTAQEIRSAGSGAGAALCQSFGSDYWQQGELDGEEGKSFSCLLDLLNSERLLVASEAIGDGKWVPAQSSRHASERIVFDRLIGANRGVQFPIAKAHMHLAAAELMRDG